MAFRLKLLIWLAALLYGAFAVADTPRQLMWSDLVPKSSIIENPFARLTHDQLTALAEVAAVRDRKARGDKTLTPAELSAELALFLHRWSTAGALAGVARCPADIDRIIREYGLRGLGAD